MQQPIPNPEDITDPTTPMNMALALMAKAFKLNYSTLANQNGQIGVQNIGNGNVVAARAEGNAPGNNGNQIRCYNCRVPEVIPPLRGGRVSDLEVEFVQPYRLLLDEKGVTVDFDSFDLLNFRDLQ
ncbi:hypothetical protein Tco_1282437 [Tanacetum coccineum]